MSRGKFIALEGIDGSGLTTQAAMLREWFRGRGSRCLLTKEPSDGPVGALIRQVITKHANGPKEHGELEHYFALLFAADRLYHLSTLIEPALRQGVHVVTDRYRLSSFAYQGLAVDFESLRAMNANCRPPDLTVFLDVPVQVCMTRIDGERWHPDLYEEGHKLDKVRGRFLEAIGRLAADGELIETVPGTESPETVHRSVVRAVQRLLGGDRSRRTRRAPAEPAAMTVAR